MEEQQLAWSVFLLEADMYAMLDGVWNRELISENCALNSDHCQTSPTYLTEGLPQLLLLAMTMTHWHAPFNTTVLDLFTTTVNVPLRQEFNKIIVFL